MALRARLGMLRGHNIDLEGSKVFASKTAQTWLVCCSWRAVDQQCSTGMVSENWQLEKEMSGVQILHWKRIGGGTSEAMVYLLHLTIDGGVLVGFLTAFTLVTVLFLFIHISRTCQTWNRLEKMKVAGFSRRRKSDSEHSCQSAALQRVVLALWHARVHMLHDARREDC